MFAVKQLGWEQIYTNYGLQEWTTINRFSVQCDLFTEILKEHGAKFLSTYQQNAYGEYRTYSINFISNKHLHTLGISSVNFHFFSPEIWYGCKGASNRYVINYNTRKGIGNSSVFPNHGNIVLKRLWTYIRVAIESNSYCSNYQY
jgi:hypothetical protein